MKTFKLGAAIIAGLHFVSALGVEADLVASLLALGLAIADLMPWRFKPRLLALGHCQRSRTRQELRTVRAGIPYLALSGCRATRRHVWAVKYARILQLNLRVLRQNMHHVIMISSEGCAMADTEKRENFVRLAEGRTQLALDAIRKLGNLSNRRAYDFNDADIRKISKALKDAISDVERRFGASTDSADTNFKL